MNSHAVVFGQLAGGLAFLSFFPYLHSILKGKTKPQRATFAIWSVVNIVTFLSYFASGARETIWVALVYAIFQIVIFLLSFKYGVGGSSRLDIVCLLGAATGVFLWIITKNPLTALYLSIFVEFLGLVPTIKKSYIYPKTENTLSWSIASFGSFLNLFAITSFKPEIALYPIYLFLGDIVVVLLLVLPNFRPEHKTFPHS